MTKKEIKRFVRSLPNRQLPMGLKVIRISEKTGIRLMTEKGIKFDVSFDEFEKEIIVPLKNKIIKHENIQ